VERCEDEQKEIDPLADGTYLMLLVLREENCDCTFAKLILQPPSRNMPVLELFFYYFFAFSFFFFYSILVSSMRISTFCNTSRVWVSDDIHVFDTHMGLHNMQELHTWVKWL
jgi:hypothetical protein